MVDETKRFKLILNTINKSIENTKLLDFFNNLSSDEVLLIHEIFEDVLQMEKRLNAVDASIYAEEQDDEQYNYVARQLHSPDSDPSLIVQEQMESEQQHLQLQTALSSLDERSQDILRNRWLTEDDAMTLQELADKYGVSAERIRQLEKNALEKLKKLMH